MIKKIRIYRNIEINEEIKMFVQNVVFRDFGVLRLREEAIFLRKVRLYYY